MNTTQNKGNGYLEIVFTDRNKDYGSFELRKNYSNRMRNGLISTIALVCLIVFSTLKSDKAIADGGIKSKGPKPILDTLRVVKIRLPKTPKIIPSPIQRLKVNPIVATPKFQNNIPTAIVNDQKFVQNPIATIAPKEVGSGSSTQPIIPTTGGDIGTPITTGGAGGGKPIGGIAKIGDKDGIESANAVDQVPEYPGGEKALKAFLSKYLEYPDEAKEKDIEGKVEINFVVFEDGSIQQISETAKDDNGFGTEGKRVIGKMPKWRPAMVGGKPVKCYFSVPISFVLND